MSEKVSSKTLHRLTFQEVVKLRKITDGIHNPYVLAKWIPEKDVEGLVKELDELEQNPNIHCNNCNDISAVNLVSYLLAKLGIEKRETE